MKTETRCACGDPTCTAWYEDGATKHWVNCRYGNRVATCYHEPRCGYLRPGDWDGPFGAWVKAGPDWGMVGRWWGEEYP